MNIGEWTLRSRRVVTPSGIRAADILIRSETIAVLADFEAADAEGVILDVGDLAVLPGVVALRLGGEGPPDGSGYEDATRDAGAGGVTTLVDLRPEQVSGPTSPTDFIASMMADEGKLRVDCGVVVRLGRGDAEQVESWVEAGALGIEAILDVTGPGLSRVSGEADLRAVMPTLARLDRPLLVHPRTSATPTNGGRVGRFGTSMPEAEFEALRLLIRLCRETRCRVHLIHPTATEALPMIVEARSEGLPLTVETCPHHLSFAAEEIAGGVPTFPVHPKNPEPTPRDRLWEVLRAGHLSSVGADHPRAFPIPPHAGPGEVRLARREFTSLRFALPAVWTEARRRGCSLEDLARWMSAGTAGVFGLSKKKGSIDPGLDADLVVFDPDATGIADPDPLHRRHPFPPLDGRELFGRVEATILRGALIHEGGRFPEAARGSVVLRLQDTLPMHRVIP